jgi:hypothetical protein
MGHHLRKDKTCLNCGAIVDERFCSRCGQENIETKESFGHVIRHFFEDFTHYDSKFFVTIKDLLVKPGFLTIEYLSGKRHRYLHPIRMYLFISFVYFLVVLSVGQFGAAIERGLMEKASYNDRKMIADSVATMITEAKEDTTRGKITEPVLRHVHRLVRLPSDSLQERFNLTLIGGIDYRFLVRYDSIQQSLPADQRDTGIKPWMYRRWLHTTERHGLGSVSLLIQKTRLVIPKMMFILLPLFALVLKLLYGWKKYFYAEHAIFTLHLHCAIFLLFLFSALVVLVAPSVKAYINMVELVLLMTYFVIALRTVYQQSWWITILKSMMVAIMYMGFLLVGTAVIGFTALL